MEAAPNRAGGTTSRSGVPGRRRTASKRCCIFMMLPVAVGKERAAAANEQRLGTRGLQCDVNRALQFVGVAVDDVGKDAALMP